MSPFQTSASSLCMPITDFRAISTQRTISQMTVTENVTMFGATWNKETPTAVGLPPTADTYDTYHLVRFLNNSRPVEMALAPFSLQHRSRCCSRIMVPLCTSQHLPHAWPGTQISRSQNVRYQHNPPPPPMTVRSRSRWMGVVPFWPWKMCVSSHRRYIKLIAGS